MKKRIAILDFIAIAAICFITWPIIKCTIDSTKSLTTMNFNIFFEYFMAYFLSYAFPAAILVINHCAIAPKRMIINIISLVILTIILINTGYMAAGASNISLADNMLSAFLYVLILGICPILVIVVNNTVY